MHPFSYDTWTLNRRCLGGPELQKQDPILSSGSGNGSGLMGTGSEPGPGLMDSRVELLSPHSPSQGAGDNNEVSMCKEWRGNLVFRGSFLLSGLMSPRMGCIRSAGFDPMGVFHLPRFKVGGKLNAVYIFKYSVGRCFNGFYFPVCRMVMVFICRNVRAETLALVIGIMLNIRWKRHNFVKFVCLLLGSV